MLFPTRLMTGIVWCLYNNRFNHTSGWIKRSASFTRKSGSSKKLISAELGDGLGLSKRPNRYVIYRDQNANLEYIRNCQSIHHQGLHFDLDAYQYRIFQDFREVSSNSQHDYARLEASLDGKGAPSIETALSELVLLPILNPYRSISNPDMMHALMNARVGTTAGSYLTPQMKTIRHNYQSFLQNASECIGGIADIDQKVDECIKRIKLILDLPVMNKEHGLPTAKQFKPALKYLSNLPREATADWMGLIHWIYLAPLSDSDCMSNSPRTATGVLDDLRLSQELIFSLKNSGVNDEDAHSMQNLVLGMLSLQCRQC